MKREKLRLYANQSERLNIALAASIDQALAVAENEGWPVIAVSDSRLDDRKPIAPNAIDVYNASAAQITLT